jgi:hypothetical protein
MFAIALLTTLLSTNGAPAEDFEVLERHTFGPWLKATCRDRHLIPPRVEHGGADFEAGGVHGVIFWPRKDARPTFYAVSLPAKGEAMSPKGPGAEQRGEVEVQIEKVELHIRKDGDEIDFRVGPRRFREWSQVGDIARKIQDANPSAWWTLYPEADVTMKHVGAAIDALYRRGKGTMQVGHAGLPQGAEEGEWREAMRTAIAAWPMKEPPGEVLIVLGEDAPYRRLNGLLAECGLANCWKLTLAVVDAEQRWSKVPLYLPRDDDPWVGEPPPPPEEDEDDDDGR